MTIIMQFFFFFVLSLSAEDQIPMVMISSPKFNLSQTSRSCAQLLKPQAREEAYWIPSEENPRLSVRLIFGNQETKNSPESYPETLLQRWQLERRFSENDINRLTTTAFERDPSRTTYLGFAYTSDRYSPLNLDVDGETFSGLRFFDGSTVPLYQGRPNHLVSPETSSLSFEEELGTLGFRFPERVIEEQTGRPSYIFEIGLLNVERDIHNGLRTLLKSLSRYIDLHYNLGLFSSRRRLSEIEKLRPVFYVSCRKAHIKIYEEYGFRLVESLSERGPLVTSRGLYIMKAFATEMIEDNRDVSVLPVTRSERDHVVESAAPSYHPTDRLLEGLEKTAPVIITNNDFARELAGLNSMRRDFFHSDKTWKELLHYPEVQETSDISRQVVEDRLKDDFMRLNLYDIFFQKMYKLAYAALLRLPPEESHMFEGLLEPYRVMILNSHSYREVYADYHKFAENNHNALIPFF